LILHVENAPPVTTSDNSEVTVNEGETATNTGVFSDVGDDVVTLTASVGSVTKDDLTGIWTWSFDTTDGPNETEVTITAMDEDGGAASTTFALAVNNMAPTISLDSNNVAVLEGQTATNTGGFSDAGTDVVVLTASMGTITSNEDGSWTWSFDATNGPDESSTVTITATDEDGASVTAQFSLTVQNAAPQILTLNQPVVNETSVAVINGTFSDGGSLDLHTAIVDWGDGTSSTATVDDEDNCFTAEHVYTYQGPVGTPCYEFSVAVSLADDDGATANGQTTVTVNNVVPIAEILGDPQTVAEGSMVAFAGAAVDPADEPDALVWSFGDGATTTGTLTPSHAYADNGVYTVTFTVTNEEGSTGTDALIVTVENVVPTISVSTDAQTVQYSDSIAPITFTATDPGAADSMHATISYSCNGGALIAGLPDATSITEGLILGGAADQVSQATWTLSGVADLKPGNYVFRLAVTDDDGGVNTADTTLVVTAEDAQISYVGPSLVCTPSVLENTATIELRAVIRDITAVNGTTDPDAGGITTATVTFINLDSGAIIASDVPVSLLDSADLKSGAASFDWQVDIGAKASAAFDVGIIVNGHYTAAQEDINVMVSKPFNDYFTVNGFLVNQHSAGIYGGDVGMQTSIKAKVRFNAALTDLIGEFTAVIRHEGRIYQIKTGTADSLVGDPISNTATFIAKASLVDITNPSIPVSIAGNLSLIATFNDGSRTGGLDGAGLTLWNGNQLWFSSNWSGNGTVEQSLSGGSLVSVAQARPLQAATMSRAAGQPALTIKQLEPIIEEAVARWSSITGDSSLTDTQFRITDLEGSTLGLARGNTVWLDVDAAGNGWFLDPTPGENSEFSGGRRPTGVDALSVVMHEMGHVLGYEDAPASRSGELMAGVIDTGMRTIATRKLVSLATENGIDRTRFASISVGRDWLVNFLVNGGKNPNPNSRIRITL
jgi:PKD repeat protein